MHITRKIIVDKLNPTPREYMDGLVSLGIGFQYDEANDYYVWQTEDMDEPAPFYWDIYNHAKENWDAGVINDTTNFSVQRYDVTTGNSKRDFQFESNSYADRKPIIDYIKFGNTILYTDQPANEPPKTLKKFIIAPVSDADTWYYNDPDSTGYMIQSRFQREIRSDQLTINDGWGNATTGTSFRIGKYYDGVEDRFADNLYYVDVAPILWDWGFCEISVGDRSYFVFGWGQNYAKLAIDITDYINEEG